ncbi:MAG TPA: DUF2505 domain-containing protein [Acidimicrobiia bacterium]|nr:DUF2505 domain-containing protein [Acidimicrobiia bacterium]
MEIQDAHVYPVPVDAVVAMLRDQAATIEKYESMGHRDVQILECEADDDALTIKSSRVVDVDLPGFAKKVLKPTNTMVQTDEWRRARDGSWAGTFDVEVKGAPVRIAGTMRLAPADAGCRHEVTIDFQVKVPIVGGKIADWAAKNDGRRTLSAEFAFNDERLRAHDA